MPVHSLRYRRSREHSLPVTMYYVDDLVFKGKDAAPMVSFPFTAVLGKKVKAPDDYREVKDRVVTDYRNCLEKAVDNPFAHLG